MTVDPWHRRTKIVATLGPSSDDTSTIAALIDAGVDVVRLNLAHGTDAEHSERLRQVRTAAATTRRTIGILADLPGTKHRVNALAEPIVLHPHGVVELAAGSGPSTLHRIDVDDDSLLNGLEPGDLVTLGDGAVILRVGQQLAPCRFHAVVAHGGPLQGRPAIRVPRMERNTQITDADREHLTWCQRLGVDWIAVSFAERAQDLDVVRNIIGRDGPLLVAKIETQRAVENLDEVIEAADGVMVARGDLGMECPLEDVPHLQKHIVRSCIIRGKPVITATQMLESMVTSPVPTRAEVSDVANAVLDGTDAVMLSAETAIGIHPALVVDTMSRIVVRAEREADYLQWGGRLAKVQPTDGIPPAVSHATWRAAVDADVPAILCCTRSGATARTMARFRPLARLVVLSPKEQTLRQLALTWGTVPLTLPDCDSPQALVHAAVTRAMAASLVSTDDIVAVLSGNPVDGEEFSADALHLVRVPAP